MSFIPPYVEDLIEDKAGVPAAVLFGAGTSGAIALLFERSRPYALLSAAFGGMIGAAVSMAQERRRAQPLHHRQGLKSPHPSSARVR